MTQTERISFLLQYLIKENAAYRGTFIPSGQREQKRLLRSLLNMRPPMEADHAFLSIQDAFLQRDIRSRGITDIDNLKPIQNNFYLWQGDITTLRSDAIVNAANDRLLGCFIPCHGCIDNAIHTAAGIQLRLACDALMKKQQAPEPAGTAKITPAFNLPAKYVLHTVGPIITGALTRRDCELLSSCYRSCLDLAAENHLSCVAFCCISTGEFHFPNDRAAEIAVETAVRFVTERQSRMKILFNVFKDEDYAIYQDLFRSNSHAEK